MIPLHPLHLEDLRKSGLTDETIQKAKIESVQLGSIAKELGFNNSSIKSMYRIPFSGVGYCRYKIFYENEAGKDHPKYLQRKETSATPYIQPEVLAVKEKPNKPLWITEGEKKALKLIQHGELCIALSGVWNFKAGKDSDLNTEKELWNDLTDFQWKGRTVFLSFDADLWINPQVRYALYELAFRLHAKDAIIKIVTWTVTEGKGIDDYLVYHKQPEKTLASLKEKSSSIDKFINVDHENEILRALSVVDLGALKFERMLKVLAKKTGNKEKTLIAEIYRRKAERDEPATFTDDEKRQALELLHNKDLISDYLNTCHSKYLGRSNELILTKLACISRKFNRGVNVFLTGTASVGKSELFNTVLDTVWPEDREEFSRTSAQYFMYRKEPLEHKIITFYEIHGSKEAAYIVRTAITEGRLKLGTVVKGKHGDLSPMEIDKPTAGLVILSTYASGSIDWELSTRVIKIEISHDEQLARQVLRHKAIGSNHALYTPFRLWQVADKIIEPYEVAIPYAEELSKLFPVKDERFMRDFDKVLSLLKASALLYQYQRGKDDQGRIIATVEDYRLVYSLKSLISESVSAISEPLMTFLKTARDLIDGDQLPTRHDLEKKLNKTDRTLKRYIHEALENDLIDVAGKGKDQRIKVLTIPEPVSPLPEPDKLFTIPNDLMSQTDQTLNTVSKERDDMLCPGASQMTESDLSEQETGQAGQKGTNGRVLNNPLKEKALRQTGHQDIKNSKKYSVKNLKVYKDAV